MRALRVLLVGLGASLLAGLSLAAAQDEMPPFEDLVIGAPIIACEFPVGEQACLPNCGQSRPLKDGLVVQRLSNRADAASLEYG